MSIDNQISKSNDFECSFCNASFNSKKTLTAHLKSSKRCISNRPTLNINCIWCSSTFITKDDLIKHYKKCVADKENIHIITLEQNKKLQDIIKEKEDIIKSKDDIIKDLQDKLYNLANKSTTTNNTTYNVTLNCDKPLLLAKERVTGLMNQYCSLPYLKRGGEGIADWFLKYVCVNERGNICLECTDKTRKIFKYIDVNDKIITNSGEELTDLIEVCKKDFMNSEHYKEYYRMYEEHPYENREYMFNFIHFKKSFIAYLAKKTHATNIKYVPPIQE